MSLVIKATSFRVVRSAVLAKKTPNLVNADGLFVTVWPRDVAGFQKAVAAGEIPVYARAHAWTDAEGEQQVRADLTYAGSGDDRLVGENDADEPKLQAE